MSTLAIIMLFFWGHWYLSLFTQSVFYHRYSAHKMFTMSKFMEKVFYIMSWIFQGSSYLSPRAYGIMHRMHHAYPDTEKDVHSPKFSKNPIDMLWGTKTIYNDLLYNRIEVDERFLGELPDWKFGEKVGDNWFSRLFFAFAYIAFYVYFISIAGDNSMWFLYPLLIIQFVMGPFHGVIINWYAHVYGYINFKVKDTSTNLWPIDLLMWGEALHNNHHKRGNSPNFAVKWWEFDPAYPFILLLNAIGVIKLNKKITDLDKHIVADA